MARALKAGTMLNNLYMIHEAIEEKNAYITYLAEDVETTELLSIKEFYPREIAIRDDNGQDVQLILPNYRLTFYEELEKFIEFGEILSFFNSRAEIETVLITFKQFNTGFIVLRPTDGISLRDYINLKGPVGFEEAVEMFLPLVDTMAKVNEAKLFHQNINPDNIIIKDEKLVLINFGLFYENVASNLEYMPLEYFERQKGVYIWPDCYSMAATMYYALTDRVPPPIPVRKGLDQLLPPRLLGIDMPEAIEEIIMQALLLESKNKIEDLSTLKNALQLAMEGLPKIGDTMESRRGAYHQKGGQAAERRFFDFLDYINAPKKKVGLIFLSFVLAVAFVPIIGYSLRLHGSSNEILKELMIFDNKQSQNIRISLARAGILSSDGVTIDNGILKSDREQLFFKLHGEVNQLASIDAFYKRNVLAGAVPCFILKNGGYLYYVDADRDYYVLRVSMGGGEPEVVVDSSSLFIMIESGWLYYVSVDDDYGLYRMRLDTGDSERIVAEASFDPIIYKDYLYYIQAQDDYSLYKMNLATMSESKFLDGPVRNLQQADGFFYFIDESNKVKKINEAGKICSVYDHSSLFYVLANSLLYVVDPRHNIAAIDMESGELLSVLPYKAVYMEASPNGLFFIDYEDHELYLYRPGEGAEAIGT